MKKKSQFLLLFISYFFIGNAQEGNRYPVAQTNNDSLCFHFYELTTIDFDVSQKSGCEILITQLLNNTTYLLEDTLVYQWSIFNDDYSIHFEFQEESPDIFLYEPGKYHIELIVSNMYGCSDTLTKYNVIAIDEMPQIDFSFTPENALFAEYFGEVEFTNLTDPKILSDTTVVWYWDFGDYIISGTAASPVHLFSMWGDYHTTFHLKTKNSCKVALTKTVSIESELFFPDILNIHSQTAPSVFAITNLNTNIPQDNPDDFRTNHLFIYDTQGVIVYDQKNYDTYKKDNVIVKGVYSIGATDLDKGTYYYSFYYKGKSKMVHYSGRFWVN